MSLVGFKGQNHPQQTAKRGAKPEVDNLATTPEMFAPLHERFKFTLDAAALPHNTKLPRYYAPPGWKCDLEKCEEIVHPLGREGLAAPWAGERVWCNPPYSNIEPWVQKAWQDAAELVVMLVPANRCEQGWWQRHIEPFRDGRGEGGWMYPYESFRVEFLPGRPRFIKHGHDRVEPNQRPPFGCALLIWERA